jgi:cysteine synthase A
MENMFDYLSSIIGSTPLYELWPGNLPNGNRVFIKSEFTNPTGSHYDRIYLEIFKNSLGLFKDYGHLLEVSSGNAGASLAWFCKLFNINCTIILPDCVPNSFIINIIKYNPSVNIDIATNSNQQYIKVAVEKLKIKLHENKGKYYIPNHAERKDTLLATEQIGKECITQLKDTYGINKLDFFIAACGNGSTIIGPGKILKDNFPSIKVIVFDDEADPVCYKAKYSKIKFEGQHRHHKIFGTSSLGIHFPFIHDEEYNFCGLIDEVQLISEKDLSNAKRLRFKIGYSVGFTSLVSLYLTLDKIQQIKNSNFLIIFYDCGEKYEWFTN